MLVLVAVGIVFLEENKMKSLHLRLLGFTFVVIGLVFSFAVIGCANMVDDSESSSSSDTSGFPANVIVMTDVYNAMPSWGSPITGDGGYYDPNVWFKANTKATTYDPSAEVLTKTNEYIFMNIGELPEKLDIQTKVYVYYIYWQDENYETASELRVDIYSYFIAKTSKGVAVSRLDLRLVDDQLYDDFHNLMMQNCWPLWGWTTDYNSAVQTRNNDMKIDRSIRNGSYVASHCWIDGVKQY